MIFVWSVQHTGTWSTIDWLERRGLFSFADERAIKQSMNSLGLGTDIGSRLIVQAVSPNGIYQSHVAESRSQSFRLQLMLAYALPSIVPLRDPLASLLTGYNRLSHAGSGLTPQEHIDQWLTMAEGCRLLAKQNREPTFIAWDVLDCENGRRALLSSAAKRLGCPDDALDAEFAAQWSVSNSSGSYPAKVAYEQEDAEWIRRRMPGIWMLLKEAQPDLRPFLEAQGYRDLMWWN